MKVVVVGAGFGGIGAAIELRRRGFDDVEVLEAGDDIGGVWRDNTYPGAACDVQSYVYSFSFAQRREWSRPCSPQAEILAYLRDVAERYGVAERVRTGVAVESASFRASDARWVLQTEAGETIEADALVTACGQLSRPSWPAIEGIEDFGGHAFHSAQWDHDYDLAGKRVAVVGTGASAVQFVPTVVGEAAHVDLYQRSAGWMLPRRNLPYPDWVRTAIRRIPGLQALRRRSLWIGYEGFTAGFTRWPVLNAGPRLVCRLHLRRQVRDPVLRDRLRPKDPFGCKRTLLSSHWFPALQQPHVEVVTDSIARVTERGIETADGREREVDCIIWGTGFATDSFVAPMRVTGRDGHDLQGDAWAQGANAHLGVTVAGFPNLFLMYGPNTNLGAGSIITIIEAQARYVAQALQISSRRGAALEVRPEVQAASDAETQERLRHSVWTQCDSWYRDDTGRVTNNLPALVTEYRRAVREVDPAEFEELPRRDAEAAPAGG